MALLDYGQGWTERLFDLMDHPLPSKSLYTGLLVQEGRMTPEVAKLYDEVQLMNEVPRESTSSFAETPYRLFATEVPKGFSLGSMGRFWDLAIAKHNRALMESRGFRVEIQSRVSGKWKVIDIDQTRLRSET